MLFFKEVQEKLTHLFWSCPIIKSFWENVIARLNCGFPGRSRQFFFADIALAIGLRPVSSKLHQHVNFCLLRARHYIWLCETNKLTVTLYGYLKYVKSINRIHVHETVNQSLPKEWTLLYTYWDLLTVFVIRKTALKNSDSQSQQRNGFLTCV